MITLEISSRNARVQALQDRWDRMRQVITDRAVLMADVPGGGATGLLVVAYKGKASKPVYRVDTGTLAELRALEQQAATELGQWKVPPVVETVAAITPVAVALSEMFTTEQLREFERRILEAQAKAKVMIDPAQSDAGAQKLYKQG